MVMKDLLNTFAKSGIVAWIGVRSERKKRMTVMETVSAIENVGLDGDRYQNIGGNRQVTLIQAEHLAAVAAFLGKETIDPALIRRNIVVEGINLLSLKGKQFKIGAAVLEYTGECHPCSRMEENLGAGGYNAMRGHGGITAKIINSGKISLGDHVQPDNLK
jgi:MOSC domain-containing protein YiiM